MSPPSGFGQLFAWLFPTRGEALIRMIYMKLYVHMYLHSKWFYQSNTQSAHNRYTVWGPRQLSLADHLA